MAGASCILSLFALLIIMLTRRILATGHCLNRVGVDG